MSFDPPPWRVLDESVVLSRPWLTVREQRVLTSSGASLDPFHLIESPDWVAVLARTANDEILVVDQYRHGAARVSCELPAGVIDAGETPLAAAQRELREETGFVAEGWRLLSTVAVEPARNRNRAHFFFATGASRAGEPHTEACEHIAHRLVGIDALLEAVDAGVIIHGVHVGAILLARHRGWL